MDESDGVFAKRRRNLLIAGVVIIIITIANPNLDKLKLFDIEFNFENRQWQIWLGLSLWFLYTFIRVWTYYFTYIHQEYLKTKRIFIYSTNEGKIYFLTVLENYRIELEILQKQKRYGHITVNYDNLDTVLNDHLENGRIPGKANFNLTVESKQEINPRRSITRLIEIPVSSEINRHFIKRKRQFILNDNWWEYVFLIIFSTAVIASLFISCWRIW